jgi:Ca2+-binding RTX toxin-like protein
VYFAPFANLAFDNTTTDFSPNSGFPGGYALTPQHLNDLTAQGLYPRDLTSLVGVPTILDFAHIAASYSGQFVAIDGIDVTPGDIQNYKQETKNLSYAQLPRSTGAFYPIIYSVTPDGIFVADPDLGENLITPSPNDDTFPTLAQLNPNLKKSVVPFVQAGDYFGFKLESGAHTVHFGATSVGQDITYNVLNEVKGTNQDNTLRGTDSNDYINGRNGKDQLLGFGGDDLIIGGNGKDWIDGGKGNDELWGEEGKDTFIFKQGYGKNTIFDFERGETIQINGFSSNPSVTDITLLSGSKATQIQFNTDDILILVSVKSHDLSINLSAGKIAL